MRCDDGGGGMVCHCVVVVVVVVVVGGKELNKEIQVRKEAIKDMRNYCCCQKTANKRATSILSYRIVSYRIVSCIIIALRNNNEMK